MRAIARKPVGSVARVEAAFARTDPKHHIVKRLLDACLADFNENRWECRVLLRPPPSADAIEKLTQ